MPWRVPTAGKAPRTQSKTHIYRDSNRFYASARWRATRLIKLGRIPYCEEHYLLGAMVPADHVHHIIHIRDDMSRALDIDNMQSLCASCHSRLHASEHIDIKHSKQVPLSQMGG